MTTIIIGIDHGNRFIKSKEGMYTAGYVESNTQPITNDNVLQYNGKYYAIGSKRTKYKYDKTIDETYFILTLPAIAMRLDKEQLNSADIILGVGLPLSHFQLKEKFSNYFKRGGIRFKYNNKDYFINIKEVMCFPQGISGYMLNYQKYKDIDFINLFDFGQVTLDAVKIHKGKPLLESAISLNWSMLRLVKNIQEAIRKEIGIEIAEEQIETSIQGKKALFFNDNIERIIEETKINFVAEMIGELTENQFELRATMNLMIGGGSSVIQNTIDLGIHNSSIGYTEIVPQPQAANAVGYEMLINESLKRR